MHCAAYKKMVKMSDLLSVIKTVRYNFFRRTLPTRVEMPNDLEAIFKHSRSLELENVRSVRYSITLSIN